MKTPPAIIWFRNDLRLKDNPALSAASKFPLIAVYILNHEHQNEWSVGAASKWWLHYSLKALQKDLSHYHIPLLLLRGKPDIILKQLAHQTNAQTVFWNKSSEPHEIALEKQVESALKPLSCHSFHGNFLTDLESIVNKSGEPFKVYAHYWNTLNKYIDIAPPLKIPALAPFNHPIQGEKLEDWDFLPSKPDWSQGITKAWKPGEENAHLLLDGFIKDKLSTYATDRDIPSLDGTSRLSPYLHFGEISPNTIWWKLKELPLSEPFLRQLGWREFANTLLKHYPKLATSPYASAYEHFPWNDNEDFLRAWQQGRTGYPIVDAGMRQLWETGWMHNRVRMIVGSFLTKHLRLHWLNGAKWFWDTLVDANMANNTFGWQWVAGSGLDAAPYFRVFNPTLQGQKFDPEGNYIRKWVPELKSLPKKFIHEPWKLPLISYIQPIVEHEKARIEALKAFESIKIK